MLITREKDVGFQRSHFIHVKYREAVSPSSLNGQLPLLIITSSLFDMDAFVKKFLHLDPLRVAFLFFIAWVSAAVYKSRNKYPANLRRVREKKGARSFSLKTRLAYYTDAQGLFRDVWNGASLTAFARH